MKYHELAVKKRQGAKRAGRGISAGLGKTAGRGTKGQKARTGVKIRQGFEGGQNPFMHRVPKQPGFRSRRIPNFTIQTSLINSLALKTITPKILQERGIIKNGIKIKLLYNAEVTQKCELSTHAASKKAKESIEKAGGTVHIIKFPKPTKKVYNKEAV